MYINEYPESLSAYVVTNLDRDNIESSQVWLDYYCYETDLVDAIIATTSYKVIPIPQSIMRRSSNENGREIYFVDRKGDNYVAREILED